MTNYRTLGGAFCRIKNILFQELAMHYKNKIKFVVALLLLGFLSLSLWHCKTTTEPAGSAELSVSLSPHSMTVAPAEPIVLTATVSNTGDGISSETVLRWYRSTDGFVDTNTGTLLTTNAVTNLEGGTSIAFPYTDTNSKTVGMTNIYFACVDEVAGEVDPSNNCSALVSVAVVSAPDLNLTLSTSTDTVYPDENISLSVVISNTGDLNALQSSTLRWYRSTDNSLDTNTDTNFGTDPVRMLEAGASVTISKSDTASEISGLYYYFACVDPVSNEVDTDDNCSPAVEVAVVVPSLTVALSASSSTAPPSQEITLTALISNAGGGNSDATTLHWYRSADNSLDKTTDTSLRETATVPMLAPGASHSISNSITVPETAGSHYYFACVDPVQNEGDLTDDCSDAAEVVVVIPNLRVSLGASSVSVLPAESTTLMAVVTNADDGVAASTTLRWYRSADNALDTNADTEIGTNTVSSLAAGAGTTLPNTITASNVSGTYYYFACVDGVRYEVATADNCSAARAVEVRGVADLVVTLRSDKFAALPSESVIFTAMISNAGVAGAASTTLRWYRSADTNLDKSSDTLLASNTVTSLGAGASITLSNTITTASNSSTNTYFACVDQVSNELDPADNCSSILLPAVPRTTYLPSLDFTRSFLEDAGNASPVGLWSDGTTMWVADSVDDKIYAYDLVTKEHNTNEDFNTLSNAGNGNAHSLWSDGTTMWVVDDTDNKIYAYSMSTKAHVPAKDFTNLSAAGNTDFLGLWSDGTTLWVTDYSDEKLYAYDLATKARNTDKEFNSTDNDGPSSIWSDGTTMWIGHINAPKLYAYKLSDKTRDSAKDFNTLNAAGLQFPMDSWSDGTIMWVLDFSGKNIFAFKK